MKVVAGIKNSGTSKKGDDLKTEDGWMGGWMDGWMDGWVDGWMNG